MDVEKKYAFEDPRKALKRHGLSPKYSWGQNFLVSPNVVSAIAEACTSVEPTNVVEIGAGLGTLTAALLNKSLKVIAVERDREMCNALRSDFSKDADLTLMEEDAASIDYRSLPALKNGVLAGNLPYQLTGKLLRAAVETYDYIKRAVFMVQSEVADRLIAPPKTSARGSLSVIVQARYNITVLLNLKPTHFYPPPKVRSSVLVFDPILEPPYSKEATAYQFDNIVNASFFCRRKTIRNSLTKSFLNLKSEDVEKILDAADVKHSKRPEELTIEEFAQLTNSAVSMGLLHNTR